MILPDDDEVNRPSHYMGEGIEAIDVIEALGLGYHRGNVVKYVLRAGKKEQEAEIRDLSKAVWYLHREIQRLKNNPGLLEYEK